MGAPRIERPPELRARGPKINNNDAFQFSSTVQVDKTFLVVKTSVRKKLLQFFFSALIDKRSSRLSIIIYRRRRRPLLPTSNLVPAFVMKSSILRLSFLSLSLPVAACFLPSFAQPTDSVSSSSSSCTALHQSIEDTTNQKMQWFQHELSITAPSRGCHLITSQVQKAIQKDMSSIKIGMCNLVRRNR